MRALGRSLARAWEWVGWLIYDPRVVGASLVVVGALGVLTDCASPSQDVVTAAHQADVAAYAAEEQACVQQSATSGEARACVAAVQARWCGQRGTLADLGACGDSGVQDAVTVAMARDSGGQ